MNYILSINVLCRVFLMIAGWAYLFTSSASAFAQISNAALVYPAPTGGRNFASTDASVLIDGQPSFLYALMVRGTVWSDMLTVPSEFTGFDFLHGPVRVEVHFSKTIVYSATVRPTRAAITAHVHANTVSFYITGPGQYDVELNGNIYQQAPILVFANPPIANPPASSNANTLVFKAGTVTNAGVIRISRPNEHVYIAGGAVVRGVIFVDKVSNTILDGHGTLLYDDVTASDPEIAKTKNLNPIRSLGAHNLQINGLTVVVSPTTFATGPGRSPVAPWGIVLTHDKGIKVINVNELALLRDGIDIDSSSDITVESSFIQSLDDSICIKSYPSPPPWLPGNVNNILIDHDVIFNTGAGNALEIGHELFGADVSFVNYQHIDILHAPIHASAISIWNGNEANVHDINYDDIDVETSPGKLLNFVVDEDSFKADGNLGSISDITLNEINEETAGAPRSIISGYNARHTVSGIKINQLTIGGKHITTSKMANLAISLAPMPLLQ